MPTKQLVTFITFICSSLLLSSCSNYTFSTNIDKQNFTNYFAAGAVTVYENDAQLPAFKDYIGMVDGEACQSKKNSAPVSKSDARTAARKKAYKIKANAVVFTGCATNQTKQCQQLIICYAKAYHVKN
ncbi:MAG: rcsF protein [Alteromonadaceae bacterium]|nr:rcsF protein [Alteromonadaceae bacterium]